MGDLHTEFFLCQVLCVSANTALILGKHQPLFTSCRKCGAQYGYALYLSGFHTKGGGGRGGFIPLLILARGGYPPIKLQNSVFLMGILVKSFKKVFRRQIPLFFSKFVFSNCPPPINFSLAETLSVRYDDGRIQRDSSPLIYAYMAKEPCIKGTNNLTPSLIIFIRKTPLSMRRARSMSGEFCLGNIVS